MSTTITGMRCDPWAIVYFWDRPQLSLSVRSHTWIHGKISIIILVLVVIIHEGIIVTPDGNETDLSEEEWNDRLCTRTPDFTQHHRHYKVMENWARHTFILLLTLAFKIEQVLESESEGASAPPWKMDIIIYRIAWHPLSSLENYLAKVPILSNRLFLSLDLDGSDPTTAHV